MDTEAAGKRPAPRQDSSRLSGSEIETIARLLGGGFLTLYVIGLIAVNGYLFQLDVTDFGLVRARFVYTGALLAASGILPYLFLRFSVVESERKQQPPPAGVAAIFRSLSWPHRFRLTGAFLAIPAGLVVILIIINNNYNEAGAWLKAARVVLPVYILGLLFSAHVVRRFREALNPKSGSSPHRLREVRIGLAAFTALYCAALYVGIFMALSYPEIPEQFGGGRPSYVRFLFRSESISGAAELGIPVSPSGLSCKLALIYEGSDVYVIELPPKRVVRLNKDMVSGAVTKQSASNDLRC